MKFENLNSVATFVSVVLAVVVTLYAFIPKVLSDLSPITGPQVEEMLKMHQSFVSTGNTDGLLSVYHPEFSMDIVYSNGRKDHFDRSQLTKHLETMRHMADTALVDLVEQVSVVGSDPALVSIIARQKTEMKGLPVTENELVYQSLLVSMHEGDPKILKVLSTSMHE